MFGTTSRGIFILLPDKRIAFISYEPYRGPLSINLSSLVQTKLPVQRSECCTFTSNYITFQSGVEVDLSQAQVWQPKPDPEFLKSPSDLHAALRDIARLAVISRAGDGLSPLIADYASLKSNEAATGWLAPIRAAWEKLREPHCDSILAVESLLDECLGLGRGLTPSGDDFCCGLLLALNRLPAANQPAGLKELNAHLTRSAWKRTSTLSANLIECAAQGSADERLITVRDGLFSANISPEEAWRHLSGYGSTSGVDYLFGLIAAQPWVQY